MKSKISAQARRYFYGTVVVLLWLFTEVLIRNSGIIVGGIPYAIIIVFWLWLLSMATGINLGFGKGALAIALEQESEKTALMKSYNITENKNETYAYAGKCFDDFEDALNAARLDKFKEV